MDIIISHININSRHRDKCKFALKLIPLATTMTSNLFPLEVVQKCQVCVLWENTIGAFNCLDAFNWYLFSSNFGPQSTKPMKLVVM